jgi:hypothetical protein
MTSKTQLSPDRAVGVLGACLGIGVVLALIAFLLLGVTLWTAVLAALLLVCPLIIGWGLFVATRRRPRMRAADDKSSASGVRQ